MSTWRSLEFVLRTNGEIDEYLKIPRGHPQDRCKLDNKRGLSHSDSLDGSISSEKLNRKINNVIFGGGSLGKNRSYSQKVMMSNSISQLIGKRQYPEESIYFSKDDLSSMMNPLKDPLVIIVDIGPNATVKKSSSIVKAQWIFSTWYVHHDGLQEKGPCATNGNYLWFTNTTTLIIGIITLRTSISSKKRRISYTT